MSWANITTEVYLFFNVDNVKKDFISWANITMEVSLFLNVDNVTCGLCS